MQQIKRLVVLSLVILLAVSGTFTIYPAQTARAYDIHDLSTMPLNLMVGSYKGYDAGKDVDVSSDGNYAYLADNTAGLQILDITNKEKPVRVGNVAADAGVTRVAVNGAGTTAYILDGKLLKSVNIIDRTKPVVQDSIEVSLGARIQIIGNDVYVIDGSPAVRIIDASNPEALAKKGTVTIPGAGSIGIGYIAGTTAYLFDGAVLSIVDLANIQTPAVLGSFTPQPGSYADLYAANNHVYLAESSRVVSVNVSDPAHPVQESSFAMDNKPICISVSGDRAYVGTAGGSNKFTILDLSNPTSPKVLKTSYNFVSSGTNWFGVNTNNAVKVVNGYAYLASSYLGMMVLDLDKGLYVPPEFNFRNHDVVIPPADLTPKPVSAPVIDGYTGTKGTFGAAWQEPPAILRLSDSIWPGELVTAYGEGMTESSSKLAFLKVNSLNPPATPPAEAVLVDPADVDVEGQTVTAIMPADLAAGSYYVWVRNTYGWSAPAVLNGVWPRWITQDEAAPNLQVGVVGKGLDAGEFGGTLATRVVLSNGTNAYEVPLDAVNPFKVTFRIPNIPAGDYDVLVSGAERAKQNRHGCNVCE